MQMKEADELIGITENTKMLELWIAIVPEVSWILEQFSDVRNDGGQELSHDVKRYTYFI